MINKAYPEGSITEAYIVNESFTFSSMYVELKRNSIDPIEIMMEKSKLAHIYFLQ